MKKVILLAILILCVNVVQSEAKEPDWLIKIKKIKLLESTYDDVFNIFGQPIKEIAERDHVEDIELESGTVYLIFTNGKCLPDSNNLGELIGWKVPEWRIEYIEYSPNKPFSIENLHFDLSKFERKPIYDVPNVDSLYSDILGIKMTVKKERDVSGLYFFPPSSLKHKGCESK